MPLFVDPENLLDLRLGLEHEVLRRPAAEDPDRAFPPAAFRVVDDRRRLVHVEGDVERHPAAAEAHRGDVHPDGGIPGGRRVDGNPVPPRGRQHAHLPLAEGLFPLRHVPPEPVVELRRPHLRLELGQVQHLAEEGVRVEEHLVVEQDVVDPHDPLVPKDAVVEERRSGVHRKPEPEVGVVVQVRPRRDDPVDEPRLEQRHDARHAEPRGGQRAGQGESHRHIGLQHPFGKEPRPLPQPPRVVGEERPLDQLRGRHPLPHGRRKDPRAGQVPRSLGHVPFLLRDSSGRAHEVPPGPVSR